MKTIKSQAVRNEVLNAIANRQIETAKAPSKWVFIGFSAFAGFTGICCIITQYI